MRSKAFVLFALSLIPLGLAGPAPAAGPRAMLTPEERMMYRQEQQGTSWRTLNPDQRCARIRQMHQQWTSMSPDAHRNLKSRLDAEWKALPAAQKQQIEQRIAARSMRLKQNHGAARQPRCA